jgi:hypothetical protein
MIIEMIKGHPTDLGWHTALGGDPGVGRRLPVALRSAP